MPRPRRSVVGLCIAVIVLAAFLPGISALDYTLLEPRWVLLPDEVTVPSTFLSIQRRTVASSPFFLSSRAPPLPPSPDRTSPDLSIVLTARLSDGFRFDLGLLRRCAGCRVGSHVGRSLT